MNLNYTEANTIAVNDIIFNLENVSLESREIFQNGNNIVINDMKTIIMPFRVLKIKKIGDNQIDLSGELLLPIEGIIGKEYGITVPAFNYMLLVAKHDI